MKIKVNGETKQIDAELNLLQLLDQLQIEYANVAIEHNGKFLDDGSNLSVVTIKENDQLEIVRFVGGG